MQFLLIALGVLFLVVAATLRVLWWFWVEHEEAVVRERLRQRANGGDAQLVSWARFREARRERDK